MTQRKPKTKTAENKTALFVFFFPGRIGAVGKDEG
jgi:hypothetical protein